MIELRTTKNQQQKITQQANKLREILGKIIYGSVIEQEMLFKSIIDVIKAGKWLLFFPTFFLISLYFTLLLYSYIVIFKTNFIKESPVAYKSHTYIYHFALFTL